MSDNKTSRIPVVDLFAGCGGLSIGAEMAGGEVRLSVELDKVCCDTLNANNKNKANHVISGADVCELSGEDVRSLASVGKAEPLIIVGGPPCQPFSKAAYWTDPGEESRFRRARSRGENVSAPNGTLPPRNDTRRDLVKEFARLVIDSNATGFVFENVLSIMHPRNQGLVENLIKTFVERGYQISILHANAVEYGVPQLRKRFFILGHKKDKPEVPPATHYYGVEQSGRKPAVTAGEALSYVTNEITEPELLVAGRWANHLKDVPPGWNYKWHTEWAGHPNPTFEAETRFWNFLLKLSPDKPSWTIAASPGPWTGPFHWDSRRLSTREMAAIQTFPSDYLFCGSRRDRVRQIGNAVPPSLAKAVIQQVLAIQ